jgi:phytoene dehydrogenase-like protein
LPKVRLEITNMSVPAHRTSGPVEPVYRIPMGPMSVLTLAGPMLGMVRAVFDEAMAHGTGPAARRHQCRRIRPDTADLAVWRDFETAARHTALNFGLSRDIYGRALVGHPEQVAFPV